MMFGLAFAAFAALTIWLLLERASDLDERARRDDDDGMAR